MAHKDPLDDILELSALLRPAWGEISDRIPDWHPRCEGDDGDGGGDDAGDGDGDADAAAAADDDAGDAGEGKEPDWKREARKHERRAKAERKEKEDLAKRLAEIEDSNKSESEKAIARAREEAAAEERAKNDKDRRNDRLEVQVTRLAARTFADTEDALIHVQRAIDAGDVDADDIFDTEGKVQTDALKTALDELLERKPHLKAGANGVHAGDADAGKGSGPAKDAESLSVDDHLAHVQRK